MTETLKHYKLVLDTRDATLINGSTTTVKWNINSQLKDIQRNKIKYIQFHAMELGNTFYNIIEGGNRISLDTLDLPSTANNIVFDVPEGHYSISELLPVIEAGLDAAIGVPGRYTVSKSDITEKITIVSNDPNHLILFDTTVSTIDRILGFTEQEPFEAVSITANRMYDLRGLTNILVKTNIGGENIIRYSGTEGTNDGFSLLLPLDQTFGATVHWSNDNPLDIFYLNNLPHILQVELRNRKTTIVSNNNFDWNLTILVVYAE